MTGAQPTAPKITVAVPFEPRAPNRPRGVSLLDVFNTAERHHRVQTTAAVEAKAVVIVVARSPSAPASLRLRLTPRKPSMPPPAVPGPTSQLGRLVIDAL